MCGAGADISNLEPVPKKKYLEPEPRKMDRLRNTACYSMVLQNLHVHAVLRLQSREAETEDESTR